MIGALVIVFREVIEASLVIGIVAAAVKGLPFRARRISYGIALGTAGAVLVAIGLGAISHFADGNGQEIFQATVLFAAGLMLAWHNLYMAKHGKDIMQRLKTVGSEVIAGDASVMMLIGVTAIAVMREGSEIALFLYALAAGGATNLGLLGGSLIGLVAGIGSGFVLFAGLSRIPVKRLFQVSGIIILFIAAGMIAHGGQYLVNIGYLPALVPHVWDSSSLLSGNSIVGRGLSALAGYTPSPSLMQVFFWIVSFVVIGVWMLIKSGRFHMPQRQTATERAQAERSAS